MSDDNQLGVDGTSQSKEASDFTIDNSEIERWKDGKAEIKQYRESIGTVRGDGRWGGWDSYIPMCRHCSSVCHRIHHIPFLRAHRHHSHHVQ